MHPLENFLDLTPKGNVSGHWLLTKYDHIEPIYLPQSIVTYLFTPCIIYIYIYIYIYTYIIQEITTIISMYIILNFITVNLQ
jgi:hypothetical protein